MAATENIRTWKRHSRDSSLPVEERVEETTHDHDDPEEAVRQADFVTIPRAECASASQRPQKGYTRGYAERVAEALADAYGFAGSIRTSRSGRSYVFEREAVPGGIAFDLGVRASPAPAPAAAPRPPVQSSTNGVPGISL